MKAPFLLIYKSNELEVLNSSPQPRNRVGFQFWPTGHSCEEWSLDNPWSLAGARYVKRHWSSISLQSSDKL